jgi:hypothetical protein
VIYRRFRPFPDAYLRTSQRARRRFDESDLELAALRIDPADMHAAPPRYTYRCPACNAEYPRARRLRMASCGRCSRHYDARFRLALVPSRPA